MKPLSRAVLFLCLFGVTLALQSCYVSIFKAQGEKTAAADHVAGSAIEVKTRNGAVEIIADPSVRNVQITAMITCGGASQQEADERLAAAGLNLTRSADRKLIIEPVFPGESPHGGDGAKLTIRMPDAHGVTISTGNGTITVKGLAGELKATSSNGRITVENHDGDVHLETSNGVIRATDINGAVTAKSSNGEIIALNVSGAVHADSSNGKMTIDLTDDSAGPIVADTSNGSISVRVGPAFQGEVEFDTSNGRLSIDDPSGRVASQSLGRRSGNAVVGEATEHTSRLDTSNGSITFTVR